MAEARRQAWRAPGCLAPSAGVGRRHTPVPRLDPNPDADDLLAQLAAEGIDPAALHPSSTVPGQVA
ncbi:MAG TPA: hypothetical protein VKV23_10345 [Acidimicrobiales bacterium]|nr:hypothetical protein [Acidimicrobiales bacterium]